MASRNMWTVSKKLMKAISVKHNHLLTLSTKQFMGSEKRPHDYYTLSEAIYNESSCKYYNKEIYSTTSMVRIVMYLRDIWDMLEGNELATDQALWNEIREELIQDGKYWSRDNKSVQDRECE